MIPKIAFTYVMENTYFYRNIIKISKIKFPMNNYNVCLNKYKTVIS